eukprot:1219135-Prorocentrum_lima.AAC.1
MGYQEERATRQPVPKKKIKDKQPDPEETGDRNQKTSGKRSWTSTKGLRILSRLHITREQPSLQVLK